MRLADCGGGSTIMTTNFDLLLEAAAKRLRSPVQTYALGSIPRPTTRKEFAWVLHVHGALDRNPARFSELVLSDQDLAVATDGTRFSDLKERFTFVDSGDPWNWKTGRHGASPPSTTRLEMETIPCCAMHLNGGPNSPQSTENREPSMLSQDGSHGRAEPPPRGGSGPIRSPVQTRSCKRAHSLGRFGVGCEGRAWMAGFHH